MIKLISEPLSLRQPCSSRLRPNKKCLISCFWGKICWKTLDKEKLFWIATPIVQRSFFSSCSTILVIAGSKCANGYRYNKGDVLWPNVIGGSEGVMRNVQNTAACAQRCNTNAQCKAYEYSPPAKKCFLVNVNNPASPGAFESYNFCSKILKNEITQEGWYKFLNSNFYRYLLIWFHNI